MLNCPLARYWMALPLACEWLVKWLPPLTSTWPLYQCRYEWMDADMSGWMQIWVDASWLVFGTKFNPFWLKKMWYKLILINIFSSSYFNISIYHIHSNVHVKFNPHCTILKLIGCCLEAIISSISLSYCFLILFLSA